MLIPNQPVGELLRGWRRHRRVSQLDLAVQAGVSSRHISFLETGRSRPSRQMVLHLADQLEVPLRDRNTLLVAAGFAPEYARTPLEDPGMLAARAAIDLVLDGHAPYPALAVDRYWNILAANSALGLLMTGVSPHLLEAPVNVLRVTLHPQGVAPRIVNLSSLRQHLLVRLLRPIQITADPQLVDLHTELESYPIPEHEPPEPHPFGDFAIPLQLESEHGIMSFISTITVFGGVHDLTLDELAIESFYPADEATARMFNSAD